MLEKDVLNYVKSKKGCFIVLFILSMLAYGQAFFFDIVSYDDPYHLGKDFITDGLQLHDIGLLFRETGTNLWHPLTWASFYVDHCIGGTFISHAINIILHALNVGLIFLLLSKFTITRNIALWVALIHLIHPLHIESVAWVSARKDVLSLFFILLSTYQFHASIAESKLNRKLLFVSLACFLCALMSKPIAVVSPLILLLIYLKLGRHDSLRLKVALFTAYALPSIAFGLVTFGIQSMSDNAQLEVQASTFSKLVLVCQNYAHYMTQFFYPTDLSFFYPIPNELPHHYFVSFLIPILTVISLIILVSGKGGREFSVYWLMFVFFYAPTCGLITIGDALRADRYMYIPLIFLSLLILRIVEKLLIRPPFFHSIVALWLVSLGGVFVSYVSTWKNNETLYSNAIRVNEGNYLAWQNLAADSLAKKHYTEALDYLKKVQSLKPDFKRVNLGLAQAYDELGVPDQAEAHFKQELIIHPDLNSCLALANFLFQQKRYLESIQTLESFGDHKKELDMLYCANAIKLKLYKKAIERYQCYSIDSMERQDLMNYVFALHKSGDEKLAKEILHRFTANSIK